ncbi:MAG: conjugal transfer protein TraC [Nitrospirales bacterium]|nr:MAG: conjugal transfer protein TraC [Nitrospirales bacterium]
MPIPVFTANRVIQRYPLSEWLPYRAYDPDKQVFLLGDGRVGCLWVCAPVLGLSEDMIQKLVNLMELSLPPQTTVQVSFHANDVIEPILDQYVRLRQKSGTDSPFFTLAQRTRDFYLEARETYLVEDSHVRPRNCHVYIAVTMPLADGLPGGITFEESLEKLIGMERSLESVGLAVNRVDADGLLRLLHLVLNPGHTWDDRPVKYDPSSWINEQAIRLDTVCQPEQNHILLDNWVVKSLSVQQFPETWSGSRNHELIGSLTKIMDQVTCPFWVTLNLVFLDPVKTHNRLTQKHVMLTRQASHRLMGLIPMLAKKKGNFDLMADLLANGRQPIGVYYHLLLYAPTVEECEKHSHHVQALYRSFEWLLQEDHFVGLHLLLHSMPMALPAEPKYLREKLRRLKTTHTEAAGHLVPIVGDWKGWGQPVVLFTSRTGQMMTLDLFANPSGNFSVAVVGKPGAGKSFFLNTLLTSYLGIGARAWVIDAGRSYEKLCEHLGGQYIDFKKEHKHLGLNPFQAISSEPDMEEKGLLEGVFIQMIAPQGGLSDLQRSWLQEALDRVVKEEGTDGTPTSVAKILSDSTDSRERDLGKMLYPFTKDGVYGPLCNGQHTIKFDNPFVVMELDGFDNALPLRSVILTQLILKIQSAAFSEEEVNRRKILAMDESWDLLGQGGNVASFYYKSSRRLRKRSGAVVTVTQGLNDYYEYMGAAGPAILENSDFLMLLEQKPESLASLRKHGRLVLSEYEHKLVGSVHRSGSEYSEAYLITPVGRGVVRVVEDPVKRYLHTTHADELARIATWKAKGLTTLQACERCVEEDRARKQTQKRGLRVA